MRILVCGHRPGERGAHLRDHHIHVHRLRVNARPVSVARNLLHGAQLHARRLRRESVGRALHAGV
jgi:hypothetical protein